MNSKQVAKKLAKMTTRSESANAPEPVVSETEKSRPPAPFRESTEESSDRHSGVLPGSEPVFITKKQTLSRRQNCEAGMQSTDASAYQQNINSVPGAKEDYNASLRPQNTHDLYTASVENSHSSLYPRNAAESVQASPHLSFRQDDIENLSQTELQLRISAIEESRRTNALRKQVTRANDRILVR